jgi:hypothetical protein
MPASRAVVAALSAVRVNSSQHIIGEWEANFTSVKRENSKLWRCPTFLQLQLSWDMEVATENMVTVTWSR